MEESLQIKAIRVLLDKIKKGEIVIGEESRIYRKLRTGKLKHTEYLTSDGYHRVSVRVENKQIYVLSHRLLYAFYHGIEKLDNNLTINHIDHNKLNNTKANLEQITQLENTIDGLNYQKLLREQRSQSHQKSHKKSPRLKNIRKIQPVSFNLSDPLEEKIFKHATINETFSQYVKQLILKDLETNGFTIKEDGE